MAHELLNKSPADTYKDLLQLGTATTSSAGTGLHATTTNIVYDGGGNPSKLKLSQSKIEADNIHITNGTIASLATPVAVVDGGTGGSSTSAVKVLWGIDNVENTALSTWTGTNKLTTLGTIGTGTWNGTTIAVANGGTGTTTLAGFKTSLSLNLVENTALSTWTGSTNIASVGTIGTGTWNGTAIPVAYGGTGAATASGARTALGIGTLGTQAANSVAITGGTLNSVTINGATLSTPTLSSVSSINVGTINISSATIDHTTSGSFLTIPNIDNTTILSKSVEAEAGAFTRTASSVAGRPTVSISQYNNETVDLLTITDRDAVATCKVGSTGTVKGNQLTSTTDHMTFRSATETVNFGTTSQYSVDASTKDTVQSHDGKFTTGNIEAGDVIRIRQTTGGTWEIAEVKYITNANYLVLTQDLTNSYTNTTEFERISSAATEKFSVENNGTVNIAGGGHNSGHIILGAYHLWVDSTGDLRMKNGAPTSDTDGSVVGTQS